MSGELPSRWITQKAESDKAISTLQGIIQGYHFDNHIPDQEILELKAWAAKNHQILLKYPFKEFLNTIDNQLHKDLSQDERKDVLEDIFWLARKHEVENSYYKSVTKDIQFLHGICHGILADGILKDEEIASLHDWIQEHRHLKNYYPYDEIEVMLSRILSDGHIDEQERKELMALLNIFVELADNTTNDSIIENIKDIEISGLCALAPIIEFPNNHFCLTGTLKIGTKSEIHRRIEKAGGLISKSVNQKTRYLVVGDESNPNWAFACYGRKVEQAIDLRKRGFEITIVHEFDFNDFLEDAN